MRYQKIILLIGVSLLSLLASCQTNAPDTTISNGQKKSENWRTLTPEEENVIVNKGTEYPYSGDYYNHHETGTYANAVQPHFMNQLRNLIPVVVGQALMISSKKTSNAYQTLMEAVPKLSAPIATHI